MPSGQVDGKTQTGAQLLPQLGFLHRQSQHLEIDVDDQFAGLGERYEIPGRDESSRGVMPSREGLEADDRLGAHIHHRLKPRHDLPGIQTAGKVMIVVQLRRGGTDSAVQLELFLEHGTVLLELLQLAIAQLAWHPVQQAQRPDDQTFTPTQGHRRIRGDAVLIENAALTHGGLHPIACDHGRSCGAHHVVAERGGTLYRRHRWPTYVDQRVLHGFVEHIELRDSETDTACGQLDGGAQRRRGRLDIEVAAGGIALSTGAGTTIRQRRVVFHACPLPDSCTAAVRCLVRQ